MGKKKRWSYYLYNGIDRVNNKKGYNVGNCQPCCGWCNSIKSNKTTAQLRKHLGRMISKLMEK